MSQCWDINYLVKNILHTNIQVKVVILNLISTLWLVIFLYNQQFLRELMDLTIMQNLYNNITDLINVFPGNGSINTVQHGTIDKAVFSMSSTPHPVLETDQLTRSLPCDACFLWGPCRRIIGSSRITEKAVQEGWAESTRTRMEHDLSELWRLLEYRLRQSSTEWLKTK
jgi:hypothetical protein